MLLLGNSEKDLGQKTVGSKGLILIQVQAIDWNEIKLKQAAAQVIFSFQEDVVVVDVVWAAALYQQISAFFIVFLSQDKWLSLRTTYHSVLIKADTSPVAEQVCAAVLWNHIGKELFSIIGFALSMPHLNLPMCQLLKGNPV